MAVADLHIHSCLSPCGSLESSPRRIARTATSLGIDIVGLTDHNSTRNCPAFARACRREGIVPVFGAEVTSAEEAHVLSLFGDLDAAVEFGDFIYQRLADIPNRPDLFGDQPVVDDEESVLEFVEKSLIGAVSLSIDDLWLETDRRGGLCVPAHIDRTAMSVYSQLGFLPDLPFQAVESTTPTPPIATGGRQLICNSDAHHPQDIGNRYFIVEGVGFAGIRAAFAARAAKPVFAPVRDS